MRAAAGLKERRKGNSTCQKCFAALLLEGNNSAQSKHEKREQPQLASPCIKLKALLCGRIVPRRHSAIWYLVVVSLKPKEIATKRQQQLELRI